MADLSIDLPRFLLVALVVLNALKMTAEMVLERQMPYSRGVTHGWNQFHLWKSWVPVILVLATSLWLWLIDWNGSFCAVMAIGIIYWIRRSHQITWHDDTVKRLGQYCPSAGVLMVLVIVDVIPDLIGWGHGISGWDASAGVIAYSWSICGINKLRDSGWAWPQSNNIGLLLAERLYIGRPLRRSVTRIIIRKPWILFILGSGSLAIELMGFAFCRPELRMLFGCAIFSLMVFNYLLWGFFELEWGAIGLVVALGSL